MVFVVTVASGGCGGGDAGTDPSAAPATPAEIAAVCERYDEVKDQEIGAVWTALIDVAPDEIRPSLVRLIAPPGERYWEDRGIVEDFLDRCPGRNQ